LFLIGGRNRLTTCSFNEVDGRAKLPLSHPCM
jgi:hypothetical protein